MNKSLYDDYPGGIVDKYVGNFLIDYVLGPVILGVIKLKESLEKIVSQE